MAPIIWADRELADDEDDDGRHHHNTKKKKKKKNEKKMHPLRLDFTALSGFFSIVEVQSSCCFFVGTKAAFQCHLALGSLPIQGRWEALRCHMHENQEKHKCFFRVQKQHWDTLGSFPKPFFKMVYIE